MKEDSIFEGNENKSVTLARIVRSNFALHDDVPYDSKKSPARSICWRTFHLSFFAAVNPNYKRPQVITGMNAENLLFLSTLEVSDEATLFHRFCPPTPVESVQNRSTSFRVHLLTADLFSLRLAPAPAGQWILLFVRFVPNRRSYRHVLRPQLLVLLLPFK
jgi:hypothetical protein